MDPDELGTLLDRHGAALTLYARQWLDRSDAPEDIVQEAFIKLAAQRPTPDRPVPWLFRVVRHDAINAAKRARRRRAHEQRAGLDAASWFETDPVSNRGPSAIDAESATEALRGLPLDQREVIVAHLWGGLRFAEIAALRDASTSQTHRLYQAGLDRLRQHLGVPCPDRATRTTATSTTSSDASTTFPKPIR